MPFVAVAFLLPCSASVIAGPGRGKSAENETRDFGHRPRSLYLLVPPARLERATTGLGIRCSIRLSYGGMNRSGQTFR